MPEPQHGLLVRTARIPHVELHEEPVELRFGKRVRALVFDGVLGGDDQEGVGKPACHAVDAHLRFLHRFEQRGLGLRGRAVDLVGHQEVGEHRALSEHELGTAEDERAREVGRKEVRRELHLAHVETQRPTDSGGEQGLGDPGSSFEQQVPTDGHRGQHGVDDGLLADDDLGHFDADVCPQVGEG